MDVLERQRFNQINTTSYYTEMQPELALKKEQDHPVMNKNIECDIPNHQLHDSSDDGGKLLVWGCGEFGQHGHGHQNDISLSTGLCNPLLLGQDVLVTAATCGSSHTVCLTEDNRIYSWGNGNSGQLGIGQSKTVFQPHSVQLGVSLGTRVKGMTCGTRHTFIWTENGECYSFGNNFSAQLGYDFRKTDFKENQQSPVYLETLFNQKVIQVSCGSRHSLFLFSSGSIASVGANDRGQLGLDSKIESVCVKNIPDMQDIGVIGCGNCHCLAADGNGDLYVWGYGKACGSKDDILVPTCIYNYTDRSVKVLEGGDSHSMVLLDDGGVYSWGVNFEGQLGLGEHIKFQTSPTPIQHKDLQGHVVSISIGENTTAATTDNGDLYMWGRNVSQVFRDDEGPRFCQFNPYLVSMGNWKARKVSCGSWHIACIVSQSSTQTKQEFPSFECSAKNDLSEILYNNGNSSLSSEAYYSSQEENNFENVTSNKESLGNLAHSENNEICLQQNKDLSNKILDFTTSNEMNNERKGLNKRMEDLSLWENKTQWLMKQEMVPHDVLDSYEKENDGYDKNNETNFENSEKLKTYSTFSDMEDMNLKKTHLTAEIGHNSSSSFVAPETDDTQSGENAQHNTAKEIHSNSQANDEKQTEYHPIYRNSNFESPEPLTTDRSLEGGHDEEVFTKTDQIMLNNHGHKAEQIINEQQKGQVLQIDKTVNVKLKPDALEYNEQSSTDKPSSAPCKVRTSKEKHTSIKNVAKRTNKLRRTQSEDSSVCKTTFDLVPTKHGDTVHYSRTMSGITLERQSIKSSQGRHSNADTTSINTPQNTLNDKEETFFIPQSTFKQATAAQDNEKDCDILNTALHFYGARSTVSGNLPGSMTTTQLKLGRQAIGQLNREKKAPRHLRRVPSTPENRVPNQALTTDSNTRHNANLQRTQSNPNINISGHKLDVNQSSSSTPNTPPSRTHVPHPPISTKGLPPRHPGSRRPANSQKIVYSSGSSWRRRPNTLL